MIFKRELRSSERFLSRRREHEKREERREERGERRKEVIWVKLGNFT